MARPRWNMQWLCSQFPCRSLFLAFESRVTVWPHGAVSACGFSLLDDPTKILLRPDALEFVPARLFQCSSSLRAFSHFPPPRLVPSGALSGLDCGAPWKEGSSREGEEKSKDMLVRYELVSSS